MKKTVLNYVVCAALLFFSCVVIPKHAIAACANCLVYENALKQEFQNHQKWMNDEWWSKYFEPALKKLSDEVRNATMFQVATFGAFLDGQNAMSAMRALQEVTATSLKNYTPSHSICKFGTLSRSLALSQSKGDAVQLVLMQRSLARQLGQSGHSASKGSEWDRLARLKQFQDTYCDPDDFGTGMKDMCTKTTTDVRRNKDINFTRTLDAKTTLDIDLTDENETDDEKDVMALANNLYAHKVFDRINADGLKQSGNKDMQSTYLDQRAIIAKRAVAENSFNEFVGQKAKGSSASKEYFLKALNSLGLKDEDANKYLGDAPSYDAQMEILTKKLYQDPHFYASLMDSPANVNRQYAALQSFGLMQKRDIFETVARSEILMSLLLEMEIAKYQDSIQNRQN